MYYYSNCRKIDSFNELSGLLKSLLNAPDILNIITGPLDRYIPGGEITCVTITDFLYHAIMFRTLFSLYTEKHRRFSSAYSTYKKEYGCTTDTDYHEYKSNLEKIEKNRNELYDCINPNCDRDTFIQVTKETAQNKKYYMPNSDIQNHIMIMSNNPVLSKYKKMFYKMAYGKLGNTKRYSNKELEYDLEDMTAIYTAIQNSDTSLMGKACEYYELEFYFSIENVYKFLKTAKSIGRTKDEIKKDMTILKLLHVFRNPPYPPTHMMEVNKFSFGNIFCLEMDLLFEMYSKFPDMFLNIANLINHLKNICIITSRILRCQLDLDIDKILDSSGAESFLEQYTSWRHIDTSKKFSKSTKDKNTVDIKDFRDFYSLDPTIFFLTSCKAIKYL